MSAPTAATTPPPADELAAAAHALREASAQEVLAWAEQRFGDRVALASSFGPEDIVLIDLARRHAPSLRVFTLDTGRLHPETYELMEAVRGRFGIDIETFVPDHQAVERLQSSSGFASFRQSVEARRECCALRKVAPLRRALAGREAWVTGMRREQAATRTAVQTVERDPENSGLAKLNPLAAWTRQEVWGHIRDNGLPYNALHDRGYPSIGCAPCTRAVRHDEDERAGRWWWEKDGARECGLHHRVGGGR
jgi:phosphoadenosine phosphosulfate reductase